MRRNLFGYTIAHHFNLGTEESCLEDELLSVTSPGRSGGAESALRAKPGESGNGVGLRISREKFEDMSVKELKAIMAEIGILSLFLPFFLLFFLSFFLSF